MITVIKAQFNDFVTDKLLAECKRGLDELGLEYRVVEVPGAFEIPLAAQKAAKDSDAIIALGCVIRGETYHYEMVCRACTDGLMRVQLDSGVPVVFEVLMVEKMEDAMKRIDKGYTAAEACSVLLSGKDL